MGTPRYHRCLIRVVMEVIVLRQLYVVSLAHVSFILLIERIRRIFQMTSHEEFASTPRHHDAHATLCRFSDDVQTRHFFDVFPTHLSMAAMWHIEDVIKTTENRQGWIERFLRKDTELLFVKLIFRNTIKVIESSLRTPADIQRRGNVGTCPIEYLLDFRPVLHLFVFHRLDRSTRHDHTVKLLLG